MLDLKVEKIEMYEQIIYGYEKQTDNQMIFEDTKIVLKAYQQILSTIKEKYAYYVLVKKNSMTNQILRLFIGGLVKDERFERFVIPSGTYVKITVHYKFRILQRVAIQKARQYFYKQWLVENPYVLYHLEYVYYVENKPVIEVYFAVRQMLA